MSILPGWDSLESSEAWSKGFHIAGFITLFMLAVFEVLAFVYSEHKEALASGTRAKIEDKFTDRTLNDSQLASLIEKLKPFAGQEYDANTYWDSREPLALAERISDALNGAGWKLKHVTGQTMLPEKNGVLVYFYVEAEETTKKAATVLVSALNAESVATQLRRRDSDTHPRNNKVQIDVGIKPQ